MKYLPLLLMILAAAGLWVFAAPKKKTRKEIEVIVPNRHWK